MAIRETELLNRVCQMICEIPGCFLNADDMSAQHDLREDLGLDSLAMVDLIVALEDEFDLYFDPIEMDLEKAFETVGSLVTFLSIQLGEN